MELDRDPTSAIVADGMEVDDMPEHIGAHNSKDAEGEHDDLEDDTYADGDAEMEGDNEGYEEYYEAQEGEGVGTAAEGEEGWYQSTADDAMNVEQAGEGEDEDDTYHEDTEEYEEYTEEMEAEHMTQSKPDTSTSAPIEADSTANPMIAGLTETPELATSRGSPADGEAESATENAAEAAAEPLGSVAQDGAEAGAVGKDADIEGAAAGSETEAAKSASVSGLHRTFDAADSLQDEGAVEQPAGGSNETAGDDAGQTANRDGVAGVADTDAQAGTEATEDMEEEEEGEEEETLDELLTVHTLPPVLIHPPSGPPKLLFWTPDDHEVYADVIDAELDILLENQHEAYGDAKLDAIFGKIRQEIADHVEVPLGVEMVLEERALGLKMGEHDKHLSRITLLELLQVHHSCELPLPVHFYLTFEPSRFYDRFEAIRRELVVQAERRKLGEQQEQEEFVLGEGDVGDDEGYESGEDAEEGEEEEEYEEGDEEGGTAPGEQPAPTDQPNDSAAESDRSAARTGGESQAPAETDKGIAAGTAVLPPAHETQDSTAEMSHIPEDPTVPLDAAALEELHERQELEHDFDSQKDNEMPVIVPDEATGEYDEDSEMPEGHVPAEIDKAIDANAPEADATLAPEADESELQGDELQGSDAGVQETYDDAAEGADADGDADDGEADAREADAGEADGLVEGDDNAGLADVYEDEEDDGDNIEAIADKLVGDAEEELRMEDEGVNNLREAVHDGVIGAEAAQKVLGDDFVVADGVKTPVYSANDDLNPFDSYDADGAAADDFDDNNDAGDDAGDNAELDEGYETGTEHSVTGSKRFRPDGEEDEDGEVPGKKYKV